IRLVVLMRPSASSTSSSSSRSISDRSVEVATQSDRVVVVVLVVVEGAKVHATVVDRRHGVSWEAVLGPQVACVGLAVSGATIDQMSNTHSLFPSIGWLGCGAGALFAGPRRFRARVENRSRPCVTCLASIS